MKDAVCSHCQRLIAQGASLNSMNGEYLMVQHPHAGVHLDVSKPGWQAEFTEFSTADSICDGSGTVAETTNISKN